MLNVSLYGLVGGEGRENRGPRGDREYRRKEGADGDFKPEFRGGLGKFVAWIYIYSYQNNN
jgi:small subunit ribosomal protein S10e